MKRRGEILTLVSQTRGGEVSGAWEYYSFVQVSRSRKLPELLLCERPRSTPLRSARATGLPHYGTLAVPESTCLIDR